MEEEYLGSPCVDLTAPLRDSWNSNDRQHLKGEANSKEEHVDKWEETIWLPRTLNCTTAAALSFATVQWEIPDAAAAERWALAADGSATCAPDSVTSCLPLHKPHDDEEEEVGRREEQNGSDSSVNSKCVGNDFKPCDAAVGREPMTQQREHSTHQPRLSSHDAATLKSDSEEEREDCITSDAVAIVDLRPEELRDDAPMTGRADSAGDNQTSFEGGKMAEGSKKCPEECVTNSVNVDEEELTLALTGEDAPLRSKSNPFQDVPHDKEAPVVKQGFFQRKIHADIDGKRTPWGKRRWKTFYGVLKGMVLYLQKDHSRKEQQANEEVVSVHHSLAEPAVDYTKKPYVFRLQTADWRVFLFQASSKMEMMSWINRVNLVSALHSSPPFPAAVGSQRRFCRPILPASQSAHTLERQLQSHTRMLESFKADLSHLQENLPEGKKGRGKEMEEHRTRAEYLQHEICRYESYTCVLLAWKSVQKTSDGSALITAALGAFDKAMCASPLVEKDDEEKGCLTKSHSSPSLELEMTPVSTIKVKRNISERWTYRRTITPRLNKDSNFASNS